MQELGTSRRLSCLTPMSRMRLCLLRELLKEGVLIRDILLGFRMSHQVHSEPRVHQGSMWGHSVTNWMLCFSSQRARRMY